MKLRALVEVVVNGVEYQPGEVFSATREQAIDLLRLEYAEAVPEELEPEE